MGRIALRAENLSKAYQLGEIGTGTISRDLERWWAKIRGREDPFLKIGETNDRSSKSESDVVWSLRDLNFEIKQGDAVGIIGRNGAGKSTLLKILSRITSPTTGKIYGNGRVASLLEVGTGFNPELTGRENIFLNGTIMGMRKAEIRRHFDAIVDFAGVERYIDTPVKRYSSGMYVRLGFAVAAHLESEILIIDEVLAVGDAEFQQKCLGKMGELSKGEGRTVLFVSHNMTSISKLCKNSLILSKGELVEFGDTHSVIAKYHHSDSIVSEKHINNKHISYLKISQANENLLIECHYKNCKAFLFPFLGFTISDSNGTKIFGGNPKMYPFQNKLSRSEQGILYVEISEPKLLNGIYHLSIWFGDGSIDYYTEENVLSLEVNDMIKINNPQAGETGPVAAQLSWHQAAH